MSREAIWAPWRVEYIRGPKARGCIFCEALEGASDRGSLVLYRGGGTFAILNRYPYTGGHLMVVPRRHVARIEALRPEEVAELWATLVAAKETLDEVFRPEGYNVGLNLGPAAGAGVKDHLHLHVVPRWGGDTNFMPVLADVQVMPEHLLQIYDELAPGLARRLGPGQPSEASDSLLCSA